MKIAITGATGFVGRELVEQLASDGHDLRCWYRPRSNRSSLDFLADRIQWVEGQLYDQGAASDLVSGCDAVVHAGLFRTGDSFRDGAGDDVVEFARQNILGSLELIEAAIAAGVSRFVFVSTCAVHEKILDDRPLDETHPLWATTHYGAHKAAIEKFVHSYGFGQGFPICALRPTGIYGVAQPVDQSKWFGLIQKIAANENVDVNRGGKEVHVSDVAKAIRVLLAADADRITGEAYACYDQYISEFTVAEIAKELSGSSSSIVGEPKSPKHQIVTDKIRKLGMDFGGDQLLRSTVKQLLAPR